jgi:hypothetical protein
MVRRQRKHRLGPCHSLPLRLWRQSPPQTSSSEQPPHLPFSSPRQLSELLWRPEYQYCQSAETLAVLTDSSLAFAASSATRFSSASLASRSFKSFFSCSDLSPSFFNLSFSASSAKRAFLPSSDSILIGTGVDDLGRTGVGAADAGSGVVLLADESSKGVPSGRLI